MKMEIDEWVVNRLFTLAKKLDIPTEKYTLEFVFWQDQDFMVTLSAGSTGDIDNEVSHHLTYRTHDGYGYIMHQTHGEKLLEGIRDHEIDMGEVCDHCEFKKKVVKA